MTILDSDNLILTDTDGAIATLTLNDPDKRNALSSTMFDAFESTLDDVASRNDVHVVVLQGNGTCFSAGFDLREAADQPALLGEFILRLSGLCKQLRRMRHVVIAAAHGAAIAGGCAMISACDLVVASRTTKIGYPVHRIGVSPAVSAATLQQAVGAGMARTMMMGGELITGEFAHQRGLVSLCVDSDDDVQPAARALAKTIAGHGVVALRTTKQWLNELDGSLVDAQFTGPAEGTAEITTGDEAISMLQAVWASKRN